MTGKSSARHRVTNWTTVNGAEPSGTRTADLKSPSGWRRTGLASSEINTLPRLLAQAGYRTIHVGKAHFGSIGSYAQFPQNIGFDVNIAGSEIGHPASYYGTNDFGTGSNHVPGLEAYHGQDIFLTEALTLEMNKQIESAVTNGVPFFAYMAHYAVHSPWNADERFSANYSGLNDTQRAFATLIEGMDKSLGDILNKLEALGAAENTLVVFLSDNGGDYVNTPLRSKKGTLYEGGVRVPMIWSWAKTNSANPLQSALPIASGSRQSDSVLAWDIYPTLLGLAGISIPPAVDGEDLSGYLRGTPDFHRAQQFSIHYPHHRAPQNPGSIWRDGDWKLIYDYQTGASKLYNMASDLSETNNLAASQPERVMAMSRDLARDLNRLGALFPERITNSVPVPPVMPYLPLLDLDDDGVPDLQEDANTNGLQDAGETDPCLNDTDGDCTPDGAEIRTGTDPLNPASKFVMSLAAPGGPSRHFFWPSKAGAFYRVEQSRTLTPVSWETVADDVPGETGQTFFDPPASHPGEAAQFYRVVLK
jgi:arylsulfatase A-like enzyme